MNQQVDEYFRKVEKWRDELTALRRVVLACDFNEEFKWRSPCYTYQSKNVVIFADLKGCCTLGFFKGALLPDPHGILAKSGENTRSARVIRFTSLQEIEEMEPILKSYLQAAIEVEKSGRKVEPVDHESFQIPTELNEQFKQNPALQSAFNALTPGRQRAYLLYFAGAKQSKTRTTRIERYAEQILDGKGLNDCTCGLSKRMPQCDGSHSQLK